MLQSKRGHLSRLCVHSHKTPGMFSLVSLPPRYQEEQIHAVRLIACLLNLIPLSLPSGCCDCNYSVPPHVDGLRMSHFNYIDWKGSKT